MTTLDQPPPAILRPSEKVQHFFREHLLKAHDAIGKRLPTIKEVSRHLGVSTSTVQAVFADLAGEGYIVMVPGRGSFIGERRQAEPEVTDTHRIITVTIREPELMQHEITWGKEICAGVLRETANSSAKMMMRPFFVDKLGENAASIGAEIGHSNAAIVFPDSASANLVSAFNGNHKPVVYITAPSLAATQNFVSPDFLKATRTVAEGWKRTGRKHVVILLHQWIPLSSTCALTIAGFLEALRPSGNFSNCDVKLSYRSFQNGEPAGLTEYLECLFAESPRPDAIYATGDGMAEKAIEWLLANNIRVPEEVSVIGGTGLHQIHGAMTPYTTLQQPFAEIGRAAVRMAIELMDNGNQPLPGIFIDSKFNLGRTTTAEENRFLSQNE